MKLLISGSAGFIFSTFIRRFIEQFPNYKVVSIDKLVENYNINNIYHHPNHKFYLGDISDINFVNRVFELEKPTIVVHAATFSFVYDSLKSGIPFTMSNVVGTQVLLEASAKHKINKFIYISTDEVYGQLLGDEEGWTEESPTNPRNPYSASKYAGELMVKAAYENYKLPYLITRCCNNYGIRQPPRNLVPKIICSNMLNKTIPIHDKGLQKREWIHVNDHCDALMFLMESGKENNIYNIGSGFELENIQMVKAITKLMNIDEINVSYNHVRTSHDFRYSINCDKLKNLGWYPKIQFFNGINDTIKWYADNISSYTEYL